MLLPGSRIQTGWIPGTERDHIPLTAIVASSTSSTSPPAASTFEYVLWPFDRSESRGKLKVVTVRLASDKILTLGFR